VVGIDLSGSERRMTGFCVMDGALNCTVKILFTDREVIGETLAARPEVVSIDAPLFLPRGRKRLEDRGPPHLRACDRILLQMKIKFFPISLGPMRKLTERGMRLRAIFEKSGLPVIESFPGAVQDLLGIPRKQKGLGGLRRALLKYGLKGDATRREPDGRRAGRDDLLSPRKDVS